MSIQRSQSEQQWYSEVEPLKIGTKSIPKSALNRKNSKVKGPREFSPVIGGTKKTIKKAVTFDQMDEIIQYHQPSPEPEMEAFDEDQEYEEDYEFADNLYSRPLPSLPIETMDKSASAPNLSIHNDITDARLTPAERTTAAMDVSSPQPVFVPGHKHGDSWRGSWGALHESLSIGRQSSVRSADDSVEDEGVNFLDNLPAPTRKESLLDEQRRPQTTVHVKQPQQSAPEPKKVSLPELDRTYSQRRRAIRTMLDGVNNANQHNKVQSIPEEDERDSEDRESSMEEIIEKVEAAVRASQSPSQQHQLQDNAGTLPAKEADTLSQDNKRDDVPSDSVVAGPQTRPQHHPIPTPLLIQESTMFHQELPHMDVCMSPSLEDVSMVGARVDSVQRVSSAAGTPKLTEVSVTPTLEEIATSPFSLESSNANWGQLRTSTPSQHPPLPVNIQRAPSPIPIENEAPAVPNVPETPSVKPVLNTITEGNETSTGPSNETMTKESSTIIQPLSTVSDWTETGRARTTVVDDQRSTTSPGDMPSAPKTVENHTTPTPSASGQSKTNVADPSFDFTIPILPDETLDLSRGENTHVNSEILPPSHILSELDSPPTVRSQPQVPPHGETSHEISNDTGIKASPAQDPGTSSDYNSKRFSADSFMDSTQEGQVSIMATEPTSSRAVYVQIPQKASSEYENSRDSGISHTSNIAPELPAHSECSEQSFPVAQLSVSDSSEVHPDISTPDAGNVQHSRSLDIAANFSSPQSSPLLEKQPRQHLLVPPQLDSDLSESEDSVHEDHDFAIPRTESDWVTDNEGTPRTTTLEDISSLPGRLPSHPQLPTGTSTDSNMGPGFPSAGSSAFPGSATTTRTSTFGMSLDPSFCDESVFSAGMGQSLDDFNSELAQYTSPNEAEEARKNRGYILRENDSVIMASLGEDDFRASRQSSRAGRASSVGQHGSKRRGGYVNRLHSSSEFTSSSWVDEGPALPTHDELPEQSFDFDQSLSVPKRMSRLNSIDPPSRIASTNGGSFSNVRGSSSSQTFRRYASLNNATSLPQLPEEKDRSDILIEPDMKELPPPPMQERREASHSETPLQTETHEVDLPPIHPTEAALSEQEEVDSDAIPEPLEAFHTPEVTAEPEDISDDPIAEDAGVDDSGNKRYPSVLRGPKIVKPSVVKQEKTEPEKGVLKQSTSSGPSILVGSPNRSVRPTSMLPNSNVRNVKPEVGETETAPQRRFRERHRSAPAMLVPQEKGHLFIKINEVSNLVVPALVRPDASVAVTIDNGEQLITTSRSKMDTCTRVNQEYDLAVKDGLTCFLTVRLTRDIAAPNPPKLEQRRSLTNFFRRKPKAKAPKPQSSESDDAWNDWVASDGTLGLTEIKFSEIKQYAFGRPYSASLVCHNRAGSHPTCCLKVTMMYIPRMSRADVMPRSMEQAVKEIESAKTTLVTAKTGYMLQTGGDCRRTRRRWFILDDDMLISHSESTHKPRATINLRKAVQVIPSIHRSDTFEILFKNGATIAFQAEEDREGWIKAFESTIHNKRNRSSWVSLVLYSPPQRSMQACSNNAAFSTPNMMATQVV